MAEADAPPPSPVRSLRAVAAGALATLNENSSIANSGHGAGDVGITVPQLQFKLPDLSSSSSDSEGDEHESRTDGASASNAIAESDGRAASPPPNCAICLGRCKNKCFTDSCFHQFCFKCLCEWSKVKPECPLCKQTFKSIIHNVKSMSQFERYHVQQPTVQIPHRPIEVAYRTVPFFVDVHGRLVRADRTILSALAGTGATGANSNGTGSTSSRVLAGSTQNQLLRRSALLDMYRQEHPEDIATGGTLSQQWRRYVYDRKLYAMPVCDITGRFRDSNARFYRDNPAQIHRLMPWINRDIVVLLRNTEYDVTTVLESVKTSLSLVNILSPAFRRRLQPVLGTRTAHFIHELNNFARSPYDMIGYDRVVQYSMQGAEEIVIEFSSSGSSDEDNVNFVDSSGTGSNNAIDNMPERGRSHSNISGDYRIHSRATSSAPGQSPLVNLLSFTVSTTSEGTEAPGVSVAVNGRSAQSTAINLTTHNRASDVIDLDDPELDVTISNNGSTNATSASTSASANVAAQAAPVALSDNIELNSSSSDECEFVLERKPPHLRTPEMVTLNSESDSDVVFVEESKPLSLPLRKSTFSSSENEETAAAGGAGAASAVAAGSASRKSRAALVKHEREFFNLGASTSTGLRSSGRERERERRQILLDESRDRRQRKQQLPRRRSLRSHKDSNASVRRGGTHNDFASGDSYSAVSSSQSDEEEAGRKQSKHRQKPKRIKANKRRVPTTNKPVVTRHTRNGTHEICSIKRKNCESISKKHKRCKVETHENENTSEEEEDDGLNLQVLKTRLTAEQEQWLVGRVEHVTVPTRHSVEADEKPSTSRAQVKPDDSRSSCSNGNDDWQDAQQRDVAQGNAAILHNSKSKYIKKEQQSNVCEEEAMQNESTTSSLGQDASTAEATATIRASLHSIITHTSSDSSASSAASSTSSCSSSTSSTTTTSSHSSTSAGEESNSSLFNLELAIEDILGTSRHDVQSTTEQWSLTPNADCFSPAVATAPAAALAAATQSDVDNENNEDIAAATIALENFRNDDSAALLAMEPIYSDEDDEAGSSALDGNDLDNEYNNL